MPYEDCVLSKDAIEDGFVYGGGMAGFSGFVACHNFDGSLVSMDCYENGENRGSLVAGGAEPMNSISRGVKLYDNYSLINSTSSEMTKASSYIPPEMSYYKCFCGNLICNYPLDMYQHCVICGLDNKICHCSLKYDQRCEYCGGIVGDKSVLFIRYCYCPDWRDRYASQKYFPRCSVCASINCGQAHENNSLLRYCLSCGGSESCPQRLYSAGRHMLHANIIRALFESTLSFDNLHHIQEGCHAIDIHYRSENDTYRHGFTYKYYADDVKIEYEKMKSFFVSKVKYFKQTNSYLDLGAAFHPILDSYSKMNERVAYSLNYFSYDNPNSILREVDMIPHQSGYSTTKLLRLHNVIMSMPSTVSDEELGALFESWKISHVDQT